jgi:hypothetical protein
MKNNISRILLAATVTGALSVSAVPIAMADHHGAARSVPAAVPPAERAHAASAGSAADKFLVPGPAAQVTPVTPSGVITATPLQAKKVLPPQVSQVSHSAQSSQAPQLVQATQLVQANQRVPSTPPQAAPLALAAEEGGSPAPNTGTMILAALALMIWIAGRRLGN